MMPPDLRFEIINAGVKPYSAVPSLNFELRITSSGPGEVFAAALKCQIIIEAFRRAYTPEEKEYLAGVFGTPERWEETVRALQWTTVTVPVPRFEGQTVVEISIGCSEDHITSAGKYFYAVKEGYIPLAFLFSGTVFYSNETGQIQVMQLSWEKEAAYTFPAKIWQQMMQEYYPGTRWLPLQHEIFNKLFKLKTAGGYSTYETCIEALLDEKISRLKTLQFQNAITLTEKNEYGHEDYFG